jgi:4-amino-4-deoxy-L-arabinose transferase-like glycosyltransferase
MFFAVLAAVFEVGLRRSPAVFLALLVVLNPAVASELTGFMVDGIMFSFLTVAIVSTVSSLRSPSWAASATGVAASIVAINAKFTELVFLCIVLASSGLWCWFRRRAKITMFAGAACGTVFLGVCVWGYNPCITNTIHRPQPLYPVLDFAQYPAIDHIETGETPRNMRHRNRLLRFSYAIFGRPGNQPYYIEHNATWMWPFAARPADL